MNIKANQIDVLRAVDPQVLMQEYQECGNSIRQLLTKYGIGKSHNPARDYIRSLFLKEFKFKTSRSIQARMELIGKERIEKEIHSSNSISELLKNLGFKDIRNNRLNFVTACKALDIEHPKYDRKKALSAKKWNKDNLFKDFTNSNEQLPTNSTLKFHYLKYKSPDINNCTICNISNIWENKKLTLQLDHIDGNKKNNQLSNLRLVCPNCHSQTDTFVRKNTIMHSCFTNKKEPTIKDVSLKTEKRQGNRKVAQVPEEQLLNDVKAMSFLKIGTKYGVSGNAVRKWLRAYGHDPKTLKQTLKK